MLEEVFSLRQRPLNQRVMFWTNILENDLAKHNRLLTSMFSEIVKDLCGSRTERVDRNWVAMEKVKPDCRFQLAARSVEL